MQKNQIELALPIDDWRNKVFSKPNKKIRLATAFSGIGAIEHALVRLGLRHEIIFACDNDPFVKKSYMKNYAIKENVWFDDISKINSKKYKGKID